MPPPIHFITRLRQRLAIAEAAQQSDAMLLEAFIQDHVPEAFTTLVQRHGGMVLGVCRRILGNHHDAEDAFQATFLVLARKAATVRPGNRLVSWLYGVALRTAMKARRMEMRRKERQQAVAQPTAHLAPEPVDELQSILDEELDRLPEHYRLPILLCEFEGKTRKQAAESLGWTEGKLAGRLTRGRSLLARRLQKRGITIPAVGLFAALPGIATAVPATLVTQTVHLATLTVLGEATTAVSSTVLSLTQGVMKAMFLGKLKVLTTVALVGVLLITGLSVGGWSMVWSGEPAPTPSPPPNARNENVAPKPPSDLELINIQLVFEEEVQKSLRLTKNQVQRIQESAEKYANAHPEQVAKIAEFKKQIEALHAKIAELDKELSKVQRTKEVGEEKAMKQIAPQVLSPHAITELRKLSLQQRSLRELLNDPKIQDYLQINDEQRKKLSELSQHVRTGSTFLYNLSLNNLQGEAVSTAHLAERWLGARRNINTRIRIDTSASLTRPLLLAHPYVDADWDEDPKEVLKILTQVQIKRLRDLMGMLPGDQPPSDEKK